MMNSMETDKLVIHNTINNIHSGCQHHKPSFEIEPYIEILLYTTPPKVHQPEISTSKIPKIKITKQLPTCVGRFISVTINVLKYGLVCNRAACGAKIAPRPKAPAPITLLDLRKFLLDLERGTSLRFLHQLRNRHARQYRNEHMTVVFR